MLAIILGILKLIGLLILGILGLLLAILLLVLLVPVRYRAQGSCYGKPKGTAGASWLLHILSCQVKYDGEPELCIRVFGFRLGGKTAEADPLPEAEAEAKPVPESEKVPGADRPQNTVKPAEPKHVSAENASEKHVPAENAENAENAQESPKPESPKNKKKHRKFSIGNPFEKIRVTFRRICGKLKALREKKDQVLAFIKDEDNRRTFGLLKKQVFALLKHILPRKVRGKVRFGFDDPYTTGQILTWISPFYGLYAKNLQMIPVFEEKALEGELSLKGRIRIGTLIVIALRMFMDKNFRKLLKK